MLRPEDLLRGPQGLDGVAPVPVHVQHFGVVLHHRRPMGDADEGNACGRGEDAWQRGRGGVSG